MINIMYIPVGKLKKSRWNPRIVFDPEKFNVLKNSIQKDGIKYPLLIRKISDEYEVLDGYRRLEAARALNISEVPCEIIAGDDKYIAKTSLKIHLSQDDLTPEEIVNMVSNMIREGIYESEREACEDLGLSWRTYLEWKKQLKVKPEEEKTGIPATIISTIQSAELPDEKRKELIEELKEKPLAKEYVKKVVQMLEENPRLSPSELVTKFAEAEPRKSENEIEARGKYLYRLRESGQNIVFELVEKILVVGAITIPKADMPIVKRLFSKWPT